MKKKVLVELKGVSKEYSISKTDNKNRIIDNVNFTLSTGDKVGLIGNNGVGKTTLFKLITGVTKPSKGTIKRNGKVVALMNLEDGFNLELSGRENIMLNGLLIGMQLKEIKHKMSKIIDFSGVGSYIDQPFFTYSSGMKFRLAFAVAIASECDVLILDEIFMAGDFKFQTSVVREIKSFSQKGSEVSLIISSHMPIFLLGLINKCYEVKNGKLKKVKINTLKSIIKKRDEEYSKLLKVSNLLNR